MFAFFFVIVNANEKVRVLPPVPPKPPKRGILKGPRSNTVLRDSSQQQTVNNHNSSGNSSALLIQNTLQNELNTYENLSSKRSTDNYHSEEVNLFKSTFYTKKFFFFFFAFNYK